MKEAMYYEKLDDNKVQCHLCPNNCIIKEGKRGTCRVRENKEGKLISLVYGKLVTQAIDPIEKKPLFHFLPGTDAYSIATAGCNLHCVWCQNWDISQATPEEVPFRETTPEEVVKQAKAKGCDTIAYTYIEPAIFYEFILDTAKLAREAGIKNVMVTNGYLNEEPVKELYKYIDAANVDIKGFTEEFYRKYCMAKLKPILDATKQMKEMDVHVETTTLIIPTLNDDMDKLKEMFTWIKDNLGADSPVHLSRFFPAYKLKDAEPTPIDTLEKAYEIAKEVGLKHVYVGNVRSNDHMHTYCTKCDEIVIKRDNYEVEEINLDNNKCKKCGEELIGVYK